MPIEQITSKQVVAWLRAHADKFSKMALEIENAAAAFAEELPVTPSRNGVARTESHPEKISVEWVKRVMGYNKIRLTTLASKMGVEVAALRTIVVPANGFKRGKQGWFEVDLLKEIMDEQAAGEGRVR